MAYLDTTIDVYKQAAETPDVGLCCTTNPVWQLPGLSMPKRMLDMNYGCGSTVNPRDLVNSPTVLYVGIGGGMELLQFAYFSRREGAIIGVDIVDEMLAACRDNLVEAEAQNDWFHCEFMDIRKGSALALPVDDDSVDVAAQNCLFNIFKAEDLRLALEEVYRVLSPNHYATDELIYIESVEVCAIKDPMPTDGPCIFTGKTAIYYGGEDHFDDRKGHILLPNQPLAVCDKTAGALASLNRDDIFISPSTYFYDGGGCC